MGLTCRCKCKKCHFDFVADVGSGLQYDTLYRKTVEKMRSGEYGRQAQEFFKAFPNGGISCNLVVVHCSKCGHLDNASDMTMYVPKDGYDPAPNRDIVFAARGIIDPPYYEEFDTFNHKCPICGETAQIVPGFDEILEHKGPEYQVRCPQCSEMMDIEIVGSWD